MYKRPTASDADVEMSEMFDDEVHIKQEPSDDPFLSAPNATESAEPPTFTFQIPTSLSVRTKLVDGNTHKQPEEFGATSSHVRPASNFPRAHDSHGNPFQTVCFSGVYKGRPHHHRLICGHVIITREIETCGANCAPSRTAFTKSGYRPFQCPHRECRGERRVQVLLNPRTGKPDPIRVCQLSYVYGHDEEADTKRKEAQALRRSREHSESPSPTKVSCRIVDPTIAENEELARDPGRNAILEMRGPGVRAKANGRFKTDAEREADATQFKTSRLMRGLQVESNIDAVERKKAALKRDMEANPHFAKPDNHFGENEEDQATATAVCNKCSQEIGGVRYKCFHCPDFDLCEDCHDAPNRKHKAHHHFKALRSVTFKSKFITGIVGWKVVEDSSTSGVACQCDTTSLKWLVLCKTCEVAFHPGCFGVGKWEAQSYDHDSDHRDAALQDDWELWSGGKEFKCLPCRKIEVDELKENNDARAKRAKKRQEAEMAEQPKTFLHFRQYREKKQELEACKTKEEQALVEDKWLKVGVQQQEEREAKAPGKKVNKRSISPSEMSDMPGTETTPPLRRSKRTRHPGNGDV